MKENQHLEELSERFLSVDEAADYLHLKKGTLHNWLSEGKNGFKRIKLAGRTFVDSEQIKAFLENALEEA